MKYILAFLLIPLVAFAQSDNVLYDKSTKVLIKPNVEQLSTANQLTTWSGSQTLTNKTYTNPIFNGDIFLDTFKRADTVNNSIGTGETGQSWTVTGSGAANARITDISLKMNASAGTAYFWPTLDYNVYRIGCTFRFTGSGSTSVVNAILMSTSSQSLTNMLHVTWNYQNVAVANWRNGGTTNDIIVQDVFAQDLRKDTDYNLEIEIIPALDRVILRSPTGRVLTGTNADVSEYATPYVAWEHSVNTDSIYQPSFSRVWALGSSSASSFSTLVSVSAGVTPRENRNFLIVRDATTGVLPMADLPTISSLTALGTNAVVSSATNAQIKATGQNAGLQWVTGDQLVLIGGNSSPDERLRIANTVVIKGTTAANTPLVTVFGDGDTGWGHPAADKMSLIAGGTDRVTATTTGADITGILDVSSTLKLGSGDTTVSSAAGLLLGSVVDITGSMAETAIASDDEILIRDTSATANRKATVANIGIPILSSTNLGSQVSQVGNVGSGEDDLWSITIPANTLNTNGQAVRFYASGSIASGKTCNVKYYFGGSSFNPGGSTVGPATWTLEGEIIRTGASSQKILVKAFNFTNTPACGFNTAAATLSGSVTLKITGESTAAPSDNDVTLEFAKAVFEP